MQRIMIIGNSGAGKSTLARKLAARLNLELIHLDEEFWRPGWVETPKPEWNQKIAQLVQKESWLIDGNYTSSIPIRLERADTVILLDRSRWICLWNVLKRTIYYWGQPRPDLGPGCPERFDWPFLKYVYNYNKNYLPRVQQSLAKRKEETAFVKLRSRREINVFLKNLHVGTP